jgi:hypothetical protein
MWKIPINTMGTSGGIFVEKWKIEITNGNIEAGNGKIAGKIPPVQAYYGWEK